MSLQNFYEYFSINCLTLHDETLYLQNSSYKLTSEVCKTLQAQFCCQRKSNDGFDSD